ncbi:hypothetical protein ACGFIW_33050 [Micromonospora sp. NPDC048935]|uniref:hypothetical protein n=1 Tax=Micromonospora sp. NPDC048935 TaxID=3364262 RepID=UPI003721D5B3
MSHDDAPATEISQEREMDAGPNSGHLRHEFSGWAQTTALFIGQAMAAGVIGNLTHEALKAALGKLRRRERARELLYHDPDFELVARTAVNWQCAQHGVADQAGAEVEAICSPTSDGSNGLDVYFRDRPRGVTATVHLSFDKQRADVKAEVRLPEKLVGQRPKVTDGLPVGVLRAADGWEQLPG